MLRGSFVRCLPRVRATLTQPAFLSRAVGLGALVTDKGLDVEYRLGHYINLVNDSI